jgi:putative nucleotidyltransferase with HDIG domain
MTSYRLCLQEMILALSSALDFVGIEDICHGKRVAFMAAECARHAGWPQEEIEHVLILGLLHDCGVSSSHVHQHLVEEWDWVHSLEHASRGAELLAATRLLGGYAEEVRHHHVHWQQLQVMDLPEAVMRHANLIYLVDRVDALRAQHQRDQGGIVSASHWGELIAEHADAEFEASLCLLFMHVSGNEAFWMHQELDALEDYFASWSHDGTSMVVDYETLLELALMFANIVDSKSAFTYHHSLGVKAVAALLAESLHLEPQERESVILAALLHDLGKLRVEDAILEKPGPFDAQERLLMHRHCFDTWQLLKRISGFEEIARIAGMHHETLDGQGYPRGLAAEQVPRAARLIAVADVFQALVQNRPYRQPMSLAEAIEVMTRLVASGKLDPELVGLLCLHAEEAYQLARQHEPVVSEVDRKKIAVDC